MKKLSFIIASLLLMLVACNKVSNPVINPTQTNSLVESNNNFALKLFKEINLEDTDSNIFISPLSLSIALGMANNGAAGTTRDAILKTLEQAGMNIDSINPEYLSLDAQLQNLDPAVQFNIANSIWYRKDFNFVQSYSNICQKYFNSTVQGLDFNNPASVGIINDWVNSKTNGKIPTIIQNIDPNDVMFLINALYFNATWSVKFDTNATKNGIFNNGSQQISCQMMNRNDSMMYFQNSQAQIVQLPYGNGDYSMNIILPMAGQNIDDIISGLNITEWNNWIGALKLNYINLTMPKFKFDYSINLNTALTNFGMGVAFDANNANFSNLCVTDKLFISYVLQKTYIGVCEQGTEAAAVTVVVFVGKSMEPPPYIEMNIDHPFIFAICDKVTNSIVFIGEVLSPKY